MPLCKEMNYIKEPTSLQCGQAVLAMLSGETVAEVCRLVETERETKLSDMFFALRHYGIGFCEKRIQVESKAQLPDICILSLETPRCWHWSLYRDGVFYDPEHGVMDDFPVCRRKFYWQILSD